MMIKYFYLVLAIFYLGFDFSVQANDIKRITIPFYDSSSQSNILVTVCNYEGQTCPVNYTNSISNTNLFTVSERHFLENVFKKYNNITTNSGPPGSKLVNLGKTNYLLPVVNITETNIRAVFSYGESRSQDEVIFTSFGISSKFQDENGLGYIVGTSRIPGREGFSLSEIKRGGIMNGLSVELMNGRVATYTHYTNGLAIGKFIVWNPFNNKLIIEADIQKPYDLEKHRLQFPH